MKTKTVTALEQALSDIGQCSEPRREDEFTAQDMHDILKKIVSLRVVQHRLKTMVDSGRYTRRQLGRDFLYRKS